MSRLCTYPSSILVTHTQKHAIESSNDKRTNAQSTTIANPFLTDILAKLSRVLETQSLGETTTDGASTAEIVAKISAQIDDVSMRDSAVPEYQHAAMLNSSGKVKLPNRKLPYEVWAEQNPVNQFIKTPQKMANKDKDRLVEK